MTQPAIPSTTPTTNPAGFSPDVIEEVFGPQDAPAADPAADPSVIAEAKPEPSKTLDPPAAQPEKPVSDRLSAAIRAEKRAEAARVELQTKKKELDDREGALTTTVEELRLFEQDPTAFVAKKGWSAKQVGEFLEKLAGTHKPEAIQEKKLSAVEQELADLKKKLAADEMAKAQATMSAQQRAAEETASQGFVAHIAGAAEKYPYLVKEFSEKEAVAAAFSALHQVIGKDASGKPVSRLQAFLAQHGEPPSDEVIAEHINSIAQQRIDARAKAPWGKAGNAPTPASQAISGESNSAPQATGASPRTLSRVDTSTRAAAPRTKGKVWTAEDQAEADEASLRILNAASRKL